MKLLNPRQGARILHCSFSRHHTYQIPNISLREIDMLENSAGLSHKRRNKDMLLRKLRPYTLFALTELWTSFVNAEYQRVNTSFDQRNPFPKSGADSGSSFHAWLLARSLSCGSQKRRVRLEGIYTLCLIYLFLQRFSSSLYSPQINQYKMPDQSKDGSKTPS
jgi:hypothetical protein